MSLIVTRNIPRVFRRRVLQVSWLKSVRQSSVRISSHHGSKSLCRMLSSTKQQFDGGGGGSESAACVLSYENFLGINEVGAESVYLPESRRKLLQEEKLQGTDGNSNLESLMQSQLLDKAIKAETVREVSDVMKSMLSSSAFSPYLAAQCITSLVFLRKKLAFEQDDEFGFFQTCHDFSKELSSMPEYSAMKEQLAKDVGELDLNSAAYTFMSLRRLEEPMCSSVMRALLLHLKKNILDMDLPTLAMFMPSLDGLKDRSVLSDGSLMTVLALYPAISSVRTFIEDAKSPNEIGMLAVCLCAFPRRLHIEDLVVSFLSKVKALIKDGTLGPTGKSVDEQTNVIEALVKISALIQYKRSFFHDKPDTIIPALSQFDGHVDLLSPRQALVLSKSLLGLMEPVSVHNQVHARLWQLLNGGLNTNESRCIPKIEILYRIVCSKRYDVKPKMIRQIVEATTNGNTLIFHIGSLNEVFRDTNVCNEETLEKYLMRTLMVCNNDMSHLIRLSLRYAHNISHLVGSKRNQAFEKELLSQFEAEIFKTPIPIHFAGMLAFIINFANDVHHDLHTRLKEVIGQLPAFGLALIARAVKTRKYRGRGGGNDLDLDIYLVSCLNAALALGEEPEGMEMCKDILTVVTSSIHLVDQEQARQFIEAPWGKKMFDTEALTFSMARWLSISLRNTEHFPAMIPLVEALVDNALSRINDVHIAALFQTVSLLFRGRFDIGKEKHDRFLSLVASLLLRDLNSIVGINVLEVCKILSRYKHFTPELSAAIFNIKFMDRIDEEVEVSRQNSSSTYESRVKHEMMQLNRTVCLFQPELKVPWFHEKYCANNTGLIRDRHVKFKERKLLDKIREDVYGFLISELGKGDPRVVREGVFTPYWQFIDFELMAIRDSLSENGRTFLPIDDPNELAVFKRAHKIEDDFEAAKVERIAVIVNPTHLYLKDEKTLKGHGDLMMESFGREGYNVLAISPFEWQKMAMRDSEARKNLIRAFLQRPFLGQKHQLKRHRHQSL